MLINQFLAKKVRVFANQLTTVIAFQAQSSPRSAEEEPIEEHQYRAQIEPTREDSEEKCHSDRTETRCCKEGGPRQEERYQGMKNILNCNS